MRLVYVLNMSSSLNKDIIIIIITSDYVCSLVYHCCKINRLRDP